jgi:hypothetical protein
VADSPTPPASTPSTQSSSATRVRPDRKPNTGVPRWVMVFVIVFIALALLFVILHLTGNGFGDHMHMSTLAFGVRQQ